MEGSKKPMEKEKDLTPKELEEWIFDSLKIANNWSNAMENVRRLENRPRTDYEETLLTRYKELEKEYHRQANEHHKFRYGITFDQELEKAISKI